MTGVPVLLYAKGAVEGERLGEGGALAGSVFLQNFIVTFDYRRKVALLENV